jgi:hypothetical protein
MKLLYRSILLPACLAMSTSFGAPITLDQNLIVNFGAEDGPGSASGNDLEPVPGWTTTGTFTVVQYGASAAPVVAPGPGFGNNFFSGGLQSDFLPGDPGGPSESDQATQFIDLSSIGSSIDSGQIDFSMSGYFGGFLGQNDNASMYATFFNASNAAIGSSVTIGGFNSTARNNQSVLLYDSTQALIPAGARSVEITLLMTKVEGYYDDGYADNLSFEAIGANAGSSVPEPATWGLSAAGLALFSIAAKFARARR